jgi:deoxycytidine triphosphate deaminase
MYSDIDIRKALAIGDIICEPLVDENISVASIDLRLGDTFLKREYSQKKKTPCENCGDIRHHTCFKVDQRTGAITPIHHRFKLREFRVKPGDFLHILPGEQILGQTLEYVGSNHKGVLSFISDKSTLAREWLSICFNAGFLDNNALRVTLEMFNAGSDLIVLSPGMHIGQARFAQCATPASSFYHGKYVHSQVVEGAK